MNTVAFPQNTNTQYSNSKKLRVVTLNYLPSAYKFATDWIAENGHEHILAVTSPGIKTRATPSYQDMLRLVDRNVTAMVTSKMKSVLTPMLQQIKPDIILCFTLPIGSKQNCAKYQPTEPLIFTHLYCLCTEDQTLCANFTKGQKCLEQPHTA